MSNTNNPEVINPVIELTEEELQQKQLELQKEFNEWVSKFTAEDFKYLFSEFMLMQIDGNLNSDAILRRLFALACQRLNSPNLETKTN